ncbi:MAG: amidohydrolase family protein [Spirochaetaceae bacterium]|jgi:N-acyl-D-amino-acid deacylase|nr:amidohydrolase family protein [Spirochaetaceae bacterium]
MLDTLILNARIADGISEKEEDSLGIQGDKIVFLGKSGAALPPARCTLDAHGAALLPGIIDIHAHSDSNRDCAEKLLAQGVTSVVSGNCGLSPELDFAAFRARFEQQGYPVNQAEQIGHSSLRFAAGNGNFYKASSPEQIAAMQTLIEKAFDEGAAGLSFGLEYDPGAPFEEALSLAQTAARASKHKRTPFISIHARKVDRDNDDSILEAIALAEHTGARVVISHLVYMWNGDSLKRALDRIDAARRRGVDIWADSGMWTAYCTTAGSAVFDEDEFRRKGYDFNKVRAASGKYAGQFLNLEKYREVRRTSPKDGFIYDPGCPGDVRNALSLPDVMVSTDAAPALPGQGHPQNAGTYPYFFRVFSGSLFTLTEAARRTSLVPALALNLNKGRIAPGADADIALFDLPRLREKADFPGTGDPNALPEGVLHVFVNGVLSWTCGKRVQDVYAGRML